MRRGLQRFLPGRRLASVRVLHPRPVRQQPGGPAEFERLLVGQTCLVPRRRGKYLWLPFADGDALLVHLGMSGQFRVDDPDAPVHPHTRLVFGFADRGPQLRFVDQRMFGGLQVVPGGAALPAPIAHIAVDPFDPDFNLAATAGRIHNRRTTIKRALLDQRLVSGIGNIYADEALWQARLHFDEPTRQLGLQQVSDVLGAAQQIMWAALAMGGTSFDSLYVNVEGSSGYFARSLQAYGRAGLPCPRCGTPIVREAFMNRSSFRCPQCQPIAAAPASPGRFVSHGDR